MIAANTAHSYDRRDEIKSVELTDRRWLSKKSFEISLTRPPSFEFQAGQNVRFVCGELERYYSLVSAPNDPHLKLCVRLVDEGKFTPLLVSAEMGARFDLSGPHGYFTFKPSSRPPVFVATGTGIAPFVSMALSGVADFTLLHGVSDPDDLYYRDILSQTAARYIPCLSKPVAEKSKPPDAFPGKVTKYIREELKRGEYDFYLCGRAEMVREATFLVDDFFPNSRVFTEVFFG